jgi:hypothetical protein
MKPFPKHICVSPIRRMMPMIGPTRTSGSVKQYEIWWAALPKPAGRRRVLLLSRDDAYSVLNKFIAAEITATVRHIPIEVSLGSTEGMPKPCVVICERFANDFESSSSEENFEALGKASPRGQARGWLRFRMGRTDRCRRVAGHHAQATCSFRTVQC